MLQTQRRHLSEKGAHARREGTRVDHHVRVPLLCRAAAHAVQRRMGRDVQGQRVQGRRDDRVLSMGWPRRRRRGGGARGSGVNFEKRKKEEKQKEELFEAGTPARETS